MLRRRRAARGRRFPAEVLEPAAFLEERDRAATVRTSSPIPRPAKVAPLFMLPTIQPESSRWRLSSAQDTGGRRDPGDLQNHRMDDHGQIRTEEALESRWEAAPAVVAVIGLQLALAVVSLQLHWKLWGLPWWVWILSVGPETILLVGLVWEPALRTLERIGHRRNVALILLAIISLANAVALVALIGSLVSGHEKSGGQLLLKGTTIWGTNVIAYGLWFWGFDGGGPIRRRQPDPPPPDFQFPQMENPQLAAPGWHPRLVDYIYISFTNSIAFSPTDAMPLSRWAKLLMLSESGVSAISILLVAARAVNIFK